MAKTFAEQRSNILWHTRNV